MMSGGVLVKMCEEWPCGGAMQCARGASRQDVFTALWIGECACARSCWQKHQSSSRMRGRRGQCLHGQGVANVRAVMGICSIMMCVPGQADFQCAWDDRSRQHEMRITHLREAMNVLHTFHYPFENRTCTHAKNALRMPCKGAIAPRCSPISCSWSAHRASPIPCIRGAMSLWFNP